MSDKDSKRIKLSGVAQGESNLGGSFNGEIISQNNTDKSIEAWELTIDTNFTITEITNSWAANVTDLEPYSYILKGTYTGTIGANSSVSLGFIGVKDGEPEIISHSLTEVVLDEDIINSIHYENEFYDDCIDWSELLYIKNCIYI